MLTLPAGATISPQPNLESLTQELPAIKTLVADYKKAVDHPHDPAPDRLSLLAADVGQLHISLSQAWDVGLIETKENTDLRDGLNAIGRLQGPRHG